MASKCSRLFSRSVSKLKSTVAKRTPSVPGRPATTPFAKSTVPVKATRTFLSRSPVELGAVGSMLPLHSAVATARLISCLSLNAPSCRALSQDENDGT